MSDVVVTDVVLDAMMGTGECPADVAECSGALAGKQVTVDANVLFLLFSMSSDMLFVEATGPGKVITDHVRNQCKDALVGAGLPQKYIKDFDIDSES